jgi:hypothetical protein
MSVNNIDEARALNGAHEGENMADDDKKHILVFESKTMVLTMATDDISEISKQSWFQELVDQEFALVEQNEPAGYMQQPPAPQQQQQRQDDARRVRDADPFSAAAPLQRSMNVSSSPMRAPQPSFLSVTEDVMTTEIWNSMTPDQRRMWQEVYINRK